MEMARKRTPGQGDRVIRRALVFERALHCWDRWLDSIADGREVLRFPQGHPSLEHMRNVAKKALTELGFPSCTVFELYWLCCVFANYETMRGFKFDKLILPDWFPFPFGFEQEMNLDFKGKRIIPPEIWNEAYKKFRFTRDPLLRCLPPKNKEARFQNYPNDDFILVLPADHTARKYVKRGRPITTQANGVTMLPHKVTADATVTGEDKKVKGTKCSWCGGSMLWDDEDKAYKCISCGRR